MQWLDQANERIGRAMSWLLSAMALLAFVIVVLRYGFSYGRVDLQESVVYLHAIVLALCMAYTLRHDKHVRVDILYNGMAQRTRTIVNLAGDLLFLLPTCVVIVVVSWNYAAVSWMLLEKSQEAGGLPLVFVLKSLIPLMALLLAVQGAVRVVHGVGELRQRQ